MHNLCLLNFLNDLTVFVGCISVLIVICIILSHGILFNRKFACRGNRYAILISNLREGAENTAEIFGPTQLLWFLILLLCLQNHIHILTTICIFPLVNQWLKRSWVNRLLFLSLLGPSSLERGTSHILHLLVVAKWHLKGWNYNGTATIITMGDIQDIGGALWVLIEHVIAVTLLLYIWLRPCILLCAILVCIKVPHIHSGHLWLWVLKY